jgi:hypothetical protein
MTPHRRTGPAAQPGRNTACTEGRGSDGRAADSRPSRQRGYRRRKASSASGLPRRGRDLSQDREIVEAPRTAPEGVDAGVVVAPPAENPPGRDMRCSSGDKPRSLHTGVYPPRGVGCFA